MRRAHALVIAITVGSMSLASSAGARGSLPPPREPSEALQNWASTLRIGREITRRNDDRRPEDQLMLELFGRPLVIGGEIGSTARARGDFRIDPTREDDDVNLDTVMDVELFYPIEKWLFVFLEGKFGYEADVFSEDGIRDRELKIQRGQSWIQAHDLAESGFSLRIGRQNFQEAREWWWDADLDAIRVLYEVGNLEFQLGVARELAPVQTNRNFIEPDLEDTTFVLGQASWFYGRRNQLDVFLAHRHDRSDRPRIGEQLREDREDRFDGQLSWAGLRASGRLRSEVAGGRLGRFDYWADFALVQGQETRFRFGSVRDRPDHSEVRERRTSDVLGWGADVGVTWSPRPRGPRLTLAYAYGSGEDGDSGSTDRAFRQTGIQDNNDKFRGVNSFKFYGEILRPELSNLHILTVGIGLPILDNSSIELLYHRYRQDDASASFRNTRLKASPTGQARDIGQAVDLVVGLEEWRHWELELIGSWFRAGDAFGDKSGRDAQQLLFEIQYNY
jgi:hypothetical protein